jgi:acyl-coenzyme A thioesterase 13
MYSSSQHTNCIIVHYRFFLLYFHFVLRLRNLHGGCVATLIDICSSFAILVSSGKPWYMVGVSTDLSVAYLRGVTAGETIRIECEVQRVGKTLANMFTRIYDSENRLCYSGSHTKFNIDSKL